MQDIKKFFNTYNKQRSRYDAVSPLQVLFEFYSHRSPPESQELLNLRAHVEELTSHLPYAEQDAFLCASMNYAPNRNAMPLWKASASVPALSWH